MDMGELEEEYREKRAKRERERGKERLRGKVEQERQMMHRLIMEKLRRQHSKMKQKYIIPKTTSEEKGEREVNYIYKPLSLIETYLLYESKMQLSSRDSSVLKSRGRI